MKKLILLLLVSITLLAPLGALAQANPAPTEAYVPLGALSKQALGGWHATYTAHGREVEAKADILWMPETAACPVVEIAPMEMNIDPQALQKYQGKGNVVDLSQKKHYLSIMVDVEKKNWFLDGYSGLSGGVWDESETLYRHGDTPTRQPEGLDCSYQAFFSFMDSRMKALTGIGLDAYWTQRLSAGDVIWQAKERDDHRVRVAPMTRWGSWAWCGRQIFHGVPMQLSGAEGPSGYAICNYYGEATYMIAQFPVVERAVWYEDVPLLSFDAMKQVWEKQIEAGKLRGVDELQFGYIAFWHQDAKGERWLLEPVWILTGGYTEDVSKERVMPYYDERDTDGSLTCPMEYSRYYYNAQTGEMLQMPSDYGKPLMAYEVLTWADVGGGR